MKSGMEIALFPLPNLVLFPQVAVPLHVFEERYKKMINQCIDQSDVFGLVLLRPDAEEESEETIHRVGVTARVVEVERLKDGRMNILSAGESRFRILRFIGRSPYWTASVDLFEDQEEPSSALSEAYAEVSRLYRQATELTGDIKAGDSDLALPESPVALSYVVSYVLDIEPAQKQLLLETTSTLDRLNSLITHLEDNLKKLEGQSARKRVASKARTNGDLRKRHGQIE